MDTRQLQQSMLFRGMTELEITKALQVLEAHEKSFQKGETLLIAGTITERMGLVLEGSVTIESNDAWGNRTIISHVGQGQVFAETYALLENEPMLVDVTASEDCRVFFLRSGRIQSLKNSLEPWALKYITNLLTISMHKNLILSGRSFHTAPKTIRGRVMAYLNSVSLQKHSREFDIPFDRQPIGGLSEPGAQRFIKGARKDAERQTDFLQKESFFYSANRFVALTDAARMVS